MNYQTSPAGPRQDTHEFESPDATLHDLLGSIRTNPPHHRPFEENFNFIEFSKSLAMTGTSTNLQAAGRSTLMAADDVAACIVLEGTMHVTNGSITTAAEIGDVILLDRRESLEIKTYGSESICMLTLLTDRNSLSDHVRTHKPIGGTKMLKSSPQARLLHSMAWEVADASHCDATQIGSSNLPRVFAELVAAALIEREQSHSAQMSTLANYHVERVKQAVRDRLHEAGLTASDIAAQVGLSPTHLHRLFSENDESFTEYLWRQRLQECASKMTDASLANMSLSSIAYDCGFSDVSHFTRKFRQHFGSTPAEWRATPGVTPSV